MLTIRLSRIGKKKKPMYRLVISERARDPYGRALEILGSYNPFSKELVVKKDRIEHWINQGAQMSATVNNLLLNKEIIKGKKVRSFIPKKKKKADGEETKPTEKKAEAPKDEKPADVKKPADAESSGEAREEKKDVETKHASSKESEKPAEVKKEEKPADTPAPTEDKKSEEPKEEVKPADAKGSGVAKEEKSKEKTKEEPKDKSEEKKS